MIKARTDDMISIDDGDRAVVMSGGAWIDALEQVRSLTRRLKLKFTKELPTKPGWYYYRHGKRRDVHQIEIINGEAFTSAVVDFCRMRACDLNGEWAGPLPEWPE